MLRAAEIPHAFTTRAAGNQGRGGAGDPQAVRANRAAILQALGLDPAHHVEADQVHGAVVAVVGAKDGGRCVPDADGLDGSVGSGRFDRQSLGEFADRLDELERLTAGGGEEWQWRSRLLVFGEEEKRALYADAMAAGVRGASSPELLREAFARCSAKDPLNRVLEVDCTTLLPDQVLAFVDRLSMAHSIEVRPPFLDYRLVELAFALPGRLKIRDGVTKFVLREAVRGLLPPGILERKKEGFLLPINAWLVRRFRGFVEAVLAPRRLAGHGLLRPEAVRRLLEEHYAGRADHANRIWTLAMFQCWHDLYLGDGSLPAASAEAA